MKLTIKILFCYTTLLMLSCTTPSVRLEDQAKQLGFTQHQHVSNRFLLTIFNNKPLCKNNKLNVYIAGDGRPWRNHTQIALDPTPNHLLVLDLMSLDSEASIYLGRPCYHGQHQSVACQPLYWTHWRYSPTVVDSMVAALQHHLKPHPACTITLIGYSGGGTLAMLIAPKLTNTHRVITISGNLDVDAWTKHHNYSPLKGSLNPATEPALPSTIQQMHLIGNADDNIPANLVLPSLDSQVNPMILRYPNVDHRCCWTSIWPDILQRLDLEDSPANPSID
ncbi:MAG: alpha/beta hydrolase [Methylococcales bacterium]